MLERHRCQAGYQELSQEKNQEAASWLGQVGKGTSAEVALHSASSMIVSWQPSHTLNKQPQYCESLPDCLPLPASLSYKYFLWTGFFSSPNWKPPGAHRNTTGLKNVQQFLLPTGIPELLNCEAEGILQKSERQGTMQSHKIKSLEHANLGPKIYFSLCFHMHNCCSDP